MSSLSDALNEAARRLETVSDTPRLDAELLLAHALQTTRERLLLGRGGEVPESFAELLERRLAGEPIAYITGRRAFWTVELEVAPGALIPRPDSETLIEAAVEHFRATDGPRRILDLGTGPGTLLLAALDQWPGASGVGVDRSQAALEIARRNGERIASGRAEFRIGNWAEAIEERFDLILCNPPYVAQGAELGAGVLEHEPREALLAGPEGLDAYREIGPQMSSVLSPGGLAAVEIGFDQASSAAPLLARDGLQVRLAHDLAGRARALLLTWV